MIYEFENRLKELIVSSGEDIEINNINETTDLVRDFNFNSISIIQLIVEIESLFYIEIDDNDLSLEKLSPYTSLVEILKIKLNL